MLEAVLCDKSDFACSERVGIIPSVWRGANFAEDMNRHEHD